MTLLIGFLTMVLVLNCIVLGLLILIQLPKKEAGMGVAFGSSATDALFGAGSGNALTKMTKYSAGVFLVLSLGLSILTAQRSARSGRLVEEELQRKAAAPAAIPATPQPAAPAVTLPSASTNFLLSTTNAPAPTAPVPAAPAPVAPAPGQ
jgi:preprotein translocase subunit SecG